MAREKELKDSEPLLFLIEASRPSPTKPVSLLRSYAIWCAIIFHGLTVSFPCVTIPELHAFEGLLAYWAVYRYSMFLVYVALDIAKLLEAKTATCPMTARIFLEVWTCK